MATVVQGTSWKFPDNSPRRTKFGWWGSSSCWPPAEIICEGRFKGTSSTIVTRWPYMTRCFWTRLSLQEVMIRRHSASSSLRNKYNKCCNKTGSHKLSPLVTGKFSKLFCFYPINLSSASYAHSKNAWMTSMIHQDLFHGQFVPQDDTWSKEDGTKSHSAEGSLPPTSLDRGSRPCSFARAQLLSCSC